METNSGCEEEERSARCEEKEIGFVRSSYRIDIQICCFCSRWAGVQDKATLGGLLGSWIISFSGIVYQMRGKNASKKPVKNSSRRPTLLEAFLRLG
jgi:hypothetical protein